MNILEKSALLEGKDNWWTNPVDSIGLKPITITDGPHGVRLVNMKQHASQLLLVSLVLLIKNLHI